MTFQDNQPLRTNIPLRRSADFSCGWGSIVVQGIRHLVVGQRGKNRKHGRIGIRGRIYVIPK